jgi:hypothetical protein
MKRIVRLTESDLARIVKRVINEQSKTPIVDAGRGELKYLVVMSNPTIKAVSKRPGYPMMIPFEVSFNGMVIDYRGEKKYEVSKMYGACGTTKADKNDTDFTEMNPSTLFDGTSSITDGGPYFRFGYGTINNLTRQFCSSQGAPAGGNIKAGDSYKFEVQKLLK